MSRFILFLTLWIVTFVEGVEGAQPTVTADVAVLGSDTVLKCQFPDTFTKLEWGRSLTTETEFSAAEVLVRFKPPDEVIHRNESKFSFNKDDPENSLTIKNLTMKDKMRYWCGLESSPPSDPNFIDLFIIVPPDRNRSSMTFNGKPVDFGGQIIAEVGVRQALTLSVTGILPAATFEWMMGTKLLPETTVNTTQTDGLITSTSSATWMPTAGDHGQVLTCTASNGAPDVISINFDVEVEEGPAPPEPPGGISTLAIVGIIIGAIIFLIIMGVVIYCCCIR